MKANDPRQDLVATMAVRGVLVVLAALVTIGLASASAALSGGPPTGVPDGSPDGSGDGSVSQTRLGTYQQRTESE